MALSKSPFGLLARRLGGDAPLPVAAERAILGLPLIIRTIEASRDIKYEGGTADHCCVILDGWTCCYQSLTDGRCQILSFHVPGDLPDLQSLYLPSPDLGMATVTRSIVAFVPHAEMRKLSDQYPAIAQAFWREVLVSAATHRAWITSLGRRDARQKLAHLFCELYLRLKAVGFTDGNSMPMPLRQTDFADALGLTSVHVNRMLKTLREEGVIDLYARRLVISDWEALCAVADFNPKYLHLTD
ncbi:Crp/Fnr family transcriptional regulator [Methylobacterium sp. J-088]|uniref:Crp/Fnr family transcriptional regulator n=1 Tax=Methylobacterium sp. J-088 TaxID=2836664 RepID=UPI001FB873CE|nr:Crp/Fnr family transcriptional regulator [Methylobacterium sp. J-088]MCJ2065386.1 Crp/Fnr family transcriptional regulator [Methylobacterium sp. J-088]